MRPAIWHPWLWTLKIRSPPRFLGGVLLGVYSLQLCLYVAGACIILHMWVSRPPLSWICLCPGPYYNDYTLKSADFTLIHTVLNLVIL